MKFRNTIEKRIEVPSTCCVSGTRLEIVFRGRPLWGRPGGGQRRWGSPGGASGQGGQGEQGGRANQECKAEARCGSVAWRPRTDAHHLDQEDGPNDDAWLDQGGTGT